ncbi:MAG: DNA glycosylase [Actinobacteria bacterium]|nr:DNA glycosylase [Actinomycetota bacterium]
MPEGDTVHRSAKAMHRALAGRTLKRTDFRVPQLATTDLAGSSITEVVARGKHMLTRTDDGWTIHTHFKMEGSWHLYRTGERWQGPDWQVRVVLETDPFIAVGFQLAIVDLIRTNDEEDSLGHLGPDILGPDWDLNEAIRRITSDPGREIGDALFDQRNVAGIGNLYLNETLYLRGIHPRTLVSDTPELEDVLLLAKRLMAANVGLAIQTTTGNRRLSDKHWVFERPGHYCRRCGTPVEVSRQGEFRRLIYWCPGCQPAE